jgi:uncharacterized glyoxalase superfamily protein PhnB
MWLLLLHGWRPRWGFALRLKLCNHSAQLWFESSCLVVGKTGKDSQWTTRSSTMLRMKDADALCAQALAHGARLLHAPQTHVYGERQATLEDFARHIWTLTQTAEDVDPTVWGGKAVEL